MPLLKYSSHSTQPTPGAHGSVRKVEGSGTMVRLGEPVISISPIPPPRVNEANVRAFAESSVVVATLMLYPVSSAARNAGTVTALARDAPCGSAQAMRTNCSLSFSRNSFSSATRRFWSSAHKPCLSIKEGLVIAPRPTTRIVGGAMVLNQLNCQPNSPRDLDAAGFYPHSYSRQSAGRPLRQGPKGRRGGKSGLHGRTVPDNVRRS